MNEILYLYMVIISHNKAMVFGEAVSTLPWLLPVANIVAVIYLMPRPSHVVPVSLCDRDECLDCINVLGLHLVNPCGGGQQGEPPQGLHETVPLQLQTFQSGDEISIFLN